jgi:integrase
MKGARKGRYGQRDATLILLMARHGLRVTEAVDLHWDQVDFTKGHLHVKRLKGGLDSVHPIHGDELRALRELRREATSKPVSERNRRRWFLRILWTPAAPDGPPIRAT